MKKTTSQALQSCDNLTTEADTQTKQMKRLPQSGRIAPHPPFSDGFDPQIPIPTHHPREIPRHLLWELDEGKHTEQQRRSRAQVVCWQPPHIFETFLLPCVKHG